MYSKLRYGDGQIPINQIHFIAVLPRASYVQTESNPPTGPPDAHADEVNREADSINQRRFTVRAAGSGQDRTFPFPVSCLVLDQADVTCVWELVCFC